MAAVEVAVVAGEAVAAVAVVEVVSFFNDLHLRDTNSITGWTGGNNAPVRNSRW